MKIFQLLQLPILYLTTLLLCVCVAPKNFAQKPTSTDSMSQRLLGIWVVEKMELKSNRRLLPNVAKRLAAARRSLAKNNNDIAADSLVLRVEFRGDSTYIYKQTFARQVQYFERGTWIVRDSQMKASNLTHPTERSSFDGEKTVELSNERWVVEFTVYGKNSGVIERIYYKRKTSQEKN